MNGIGSPIRNLSPLVNICVLVAAFLGCTPPHEQLYGSDVLAVNSIAKVLQCEFKGTIIAAGPPMERYGSTGREYPVESKMRSSLLTNAKNCVHDLEGNRILARTEQFKGTQQFDYFLCPNPSVLDAYTHEIKARSWKQANISRLCKNPGPAQEQDFAKNCKGEFPTNPSKHQVKISTEPEFISCR